MQVTMPAFSSQEEVSTSSNAREQSVSSLGTAFQPSLLGNVRKVEMESTTGECDTTQEDLDCQPHEAGWCSVKISALLLPVVVCGHLPRLSQERRLLTDC